VSAPIEPAGRCPHGCGRLWTGPDGALRCPPTADRALFLGEEPGPDAVAGPLWRPPTDLAYVDAVDASTLLVDVDWSAAAVASLYRPSDPRSRASVPVRAMHSTDPATLSELVEVKPTRAPDGTALVALVLR
jgi:hypothetical protein